MNHILVVDDDEKLGRILCRYLRDVGYHAMYCCNVERAYDALYESTYDLIITDIMMPTIDGYEFTSTIKKSNPQIPILFMSAKDDLQSKQKGFLLGIDDYMVKPIHLEELVLRVTAILRRSQIASNKALTISNLTLDHEAVSAQLNNSSIPITVREFNILFKLLSYPNKTFSRSQLMDEFWDIDSDTSLRAVDVYITKLRDKFSDCDGFQIKTVYSLGYKAVLL